MAEVTLNVSTGRETGTRNSRRMRATGNVPGVVYGHGREPIAVSVNWRELRSTLITDAGVNVLLDLVIEGESEPQLSIIKEMQRHPIKRTVDHVDFLLVSRDQEITIDVPIVLEGEIAEVNAGRAMLEQLMSTLSVAAKPNAIPDQIVVDISALDAGSTVTVGELNLPEGSSTVVDPHEPVLSVQASRAAIDPDGDDGEAAGGDAETASDASASDGDGEG